MADPTKEPDAAAPDAPRENAFTLDKETLKNLIIGSTRELDLNAAGTDEVRGGLRDASAQTN